MIANILKNKSKELREAGIPLPKTKQEAIALGTTRFVPEDGIERVLRQYGSKKFPNGSIEFINLRARFPMIPDDGIEWKDGGNIILLCSHYDTKILKGIERKKNDERKKNKAF